MFWSCGTTLKDVSSGKPPTVLFVYFGNFFRKTNSPKPQGGAFYRMKGPSGHLKVTPLTVFSKNRLGSFNNSVSERRRLEAKNSSFPTKIMGNHKKNKKKCRNSMNNDP